MQLIEFTQDNSKKLSTIVASLSSRLGKLYQVGGASRVFRISGQKMGAIFMAGNSLAAIGFGWENSQVGVTSIYVWREFDMDHSPDYELDIPQDTVLSKELIDTIAGWVRAPKTGDIVVHMPVAKDTEVTEAEQFTGKVTQTANPLPNSKLNAVKDLATVAQAVGMNQAAQSGEVVLLGKNADGTFFIIPGLADYTSKIEKLARDKLARADTASMEEQYQELEDYVHLIMGEGRVKSLLVTGTAGAGKTYTIDNVIKDSGMTEGKDYVIETGSVTVPAMYRKLLEQMDGFIVFDDCDSAAEDSDGINILKGALNTEAVRQVAYSTANSFNTSSMPQDQRDIWNRAMSRILRGVPHDGDLEMFENYVPRKEKKEKKLNGADAEVARIMKALDKNAATGIDTAYMAEVQKYIIRHLPNKIDFRGRAIFVSNKPITQWDKAIRSRSYTIELNFPPDMMLDFFVNIRSKIKANISDEEKEEVLEFLKGLYVNNELKSPVDFRLMYKCFDMRAIPSWKRAIARMVAIA